MEGIIYDIKRFAIHDGPGIRTTIFFKGCPLRCCWCHNPEGITPLPEAKNRTIKIDNKEIPVDETIGYKITVDGLIDELLKDRVFYQNSGGGITISGGEPLWQPAFLASTLKLCKENILHTAVDTSGYAARLDFNSILSYTDLFLFDIKMVNPVLHKKYTGVDNRLIIQNLDYLIQKNAKIIIRFPVIPGINDTDVNIEDMIQFLNDRMQLQEIHLLPYHNMADGKIKRYNLDNTSAIINSAAVTNMESIVERFRNLGVKVKIGG